ncbi:hypothetical protein LXL04_010067 [Taraxacum kok-saghyz]
MESGFKPKDAKNILLMIQPIKITNRLHPPPASTTGVLLRHQPPEITRRNKNQKSLAGKEKLAGTAENRIGSSRSWEDSSRSWEDSSRSEEDSSIDAGKKLDLEKYSSQVRREAGSGKKSFGREAGSLRRIFCRPDFLLERPPEECLIYLESTCFLEMKISLTKHHHFFTDQKFKSRDELAYVNGFVYKVILICDRGREYKATNTIRATGSKKINCSFQLEGKYSKEYNHWMLKVICDEHNHPPAQHLEGHPFARRLSIDETRLVADLTRKNVTPRFVFMHNEQEPNYTWALNCLKSTLDECMQPRVIITDRELALINACKTVFPYPLYLCTYLFFILFLGILKYIEDNWLNKYKQMFVSVWVYQHLNFGTRRLHMSHII